MSALLFRFCACLLLWSLTLGVPAAWAKSDGTSQAGAKSLPCVVPFDGTLTIVSGNDCSAETIKQEFKGAMSSSSSGGAGVSGAPPSAAGAGTGPSLAELRMSELAMTRALSPPVQVSPSIDIPEEYWVGGVMFSIAGLLSAWVGVGAIRARGARSA